MNTKGLFLRILFSLLIVIVIVAIMWLFFTLLFGSISGKYVVRQGNQSYYTNNIIQQDDCLLLVEISTNRNTKVCGSYVIENNN